MTFHYKYNSALVDCCSYMKIIIKFCNIHYVSFVFHPPDGSFQNLLNIHFGAILITYPFTLISLLYDSTFLRYIGFCENMFSPSSGYTLIITNQVHQTFLFYFLLIYLKILISLLSCKIHINSNL